LLSAMAAAAVVNAFADRFSRWLDGEDGEGGDPVLRPEGDGGLLRVSDPPAVLTLDAAATEAARARGVREIGAGGVTQGALSAPIEVSVGVTNHCPVACDTCYLDAGPGRDGRAPGDKLDADLAELAGLGVFEIALGGGEALLDEDVVQVVQQITGLGMVPNLTTSGFGLTDDRLAMLAQHVGQVNVSWDGPDELYAQVRGWRGEGVAVRAIERLVAAGVRVGVNTVLTRRNVGALEVMAEQLEQLGVTEWQWLRLKPVGRAVETYAANRLSPSEALELWPRLLAIEAKSALALRVDCALVPFVVAHDPPLEALELLAVSGCRGGDELWSRTVEGRWAPCSFAEATEAPEGVAEAWHADAQLQAWRQRAQAPPAPCDTCTYRSVCRGGCRVVAKHGGDVMAADPECPRVRAAA
jgi:radical SAM protein with 4Fe4S-binding SPASM domain